MLPVLVELWHISRLQVGLLIGVGYLGQVVGARAFSWAAERHGRVPAAAAATAIFAVMSIACAGAWDVEALLACRFIQGIGAGREMPVAAVYISKLSKARGRGRFFMLYEMIFPIGPMVIGQVGAVLVSWLGWKTMFLIGGLLGMLIACMTRTGCSRPQAARALGGAAFAGLPGAHAHRLGAVGQRVPDCRQPQQLNADPPHDGLSSDDRL